MPGTVMDEAKSMRDLTSKCMNSNPGFVISELTKVVTVFA